MEDDLKVIAEGIETPGQHAYLEQFGCEFGQGYFFSRPVDRIMFEKLLAGTFLGVDAGRLQPSSRLAQSSTADRI